MKLSKLQQEILDNENNAVFVESSAASGKTRLITAKIKKELASKKGRIVAFTFTNAAAEEMKERIGHYDSDALFIGTIHSYCLHLLLKKGVVSAIHCCQEEEFDRLFELAQEHLQDIEPIYCLICDEAQDCDDLQFQFIFNILKTEKYFFCYDHRQSIYRWKGSRPECLPDWIEQVNGEICTMNENYRNGRQILNFAKGLIRDAGREFIDTSKAMRERDGKVVTGLIYDPEVIARTFEKMRNDNSDVQWNDWFVLCRTNEQVDQVAAALNEKEIPNDTFKRAALTTSELNEKLKDNTIKVLTIHTSKGLEADNVLVVGAKHYNLEEICISYVAATRARNRLYWLEEKRKQPTTRRISHVSNWEN